MQIFYKKLIIKVKKLVKKYYNSLIYCKLEILNNNSNYMITSTITVQELKEKVFECVSTHYLFFSNSEHSKEIVRKRFDDFSFSCTYEVYYNFTPATHDFPEEATILNSLISNLEIDFDEFECDVEEVENFVNLKLAELW